jgi:hypothetical protein
MRRNTKKGAYFPNEDEHVTATFSPDSIANLIAWFKADGVNYQDSGRTTIAASDNDPVGSLTDGKGGIHANQATAGIRPIRIDNAHNSHPCVRFNGSDQYLVSGNHDNSNQPNTFFLVAKVNTVVNNNYLTDGCADGTLRGGAFLVSSTGKFGIFTGLAVMATVANANTNLHLFRMLASDASSELFIDSVSVASGNAGDNAMKGYTFGSRYGGIDRFTPYDFCEYLHYNRSLAAGEITSISDYLKDKWGTP